jgi:hypothetical protein
VKANLNRLSFAAPENCVQKKGRKAALAQQGELVGMLVRRGAGIWTHVGFSW